MADLQTDLIKTNLAKLEGTEQIVKVDKNKAIKYKVVAEEIDLEALRKELKEWETMTEPSVEEQMQFGRANLPYFTIREERIRYLREELAKYE